MTGITAAIKDAEGLIDRALVAQPEGELAEATLQSQAIEEVCRPHHLESTS